MFQVDTSQGTQNQDLLASVLVPNNLAALQSGKSENISNCYLATNVSKTLVTLKCSTPKQYNSTKRIFSSVSRYGKNAGVFV
jgi:hypothetical protein